MRHGRRVRVPLATVACLLVFAAPAGAAFQTCTYNAGVVTATFGTGTTGTLSQSGAQIHADGVACGAATTANTDTINVLGDDVDTETLTIDLAGGSFLGGATDEPGGSDEIEININIGTGIPPVADLFVVGTAAAEHITLGRLSTPERSAINLNADEADGIDADIVFDRRETTSVSGNAGNDVLSANGGDGTGERELFSTLNGGPGVDDLESTDLMIPGDGDDTVRFPVVGDGSLALGTVSYSSAPGPVQLTLVVGGGGTATGADGHGDTDVIVGRPGLVEGSAFGDTFDGSSQDNVFRGNGGIDVINGGGGNDRIFGGSGADTLHGDAGNDEIRADTGNDFVFGDADDDIVDGSEGNDQESGGDGNDLLRQSGSNQFNADVPNGADDLSGGPGIDTLQYSDPGFGAFANFAARTDRVSVDLDDVADDGGGNLEGDNAHSDIENLTGGLGDDTLIGDGDANVLRGFVGADTLTGGDGDDTLEGLGAIGVFAPGIEAAVVDGADTIDGGGGADLVNANDGDDVIAVRDGVADTVNCGEGNDTGVRDALDVLTDCEGLQLPPAPDPEPTVTAAPTASPAPAPIATPIPKPVATATPTPPLPKAATLVTIPSTKRCVSRRRLRLRVKKALVGSVRSVEVFVNGKRKTRVTGRRVGLPVDLRGLPRGTFRVRLKITLADGRVVSDTRKYRTCRPKRRG
jgi:Ca2+-binding RTX toxin-like protein